MTCHRRPTKAAPRFQATRPGGSWGRGAPSPRLHVVTLTLALVVGLISVHSFRILAEPLAAARSSSPARGRPAPLGPVFTPEVERWRPMIKHWAADSGLPAHLIATVIQIESCGDPLAASPAGAQGLFQVMPYHFAAGADPLDIETNARAGLQYLRRSWELAGGDVDRALAGYNGGHGVIPLPASQWANETQRYVHWGSSIISDSENGQIPSPALAAWLEAGGHHLCRQAAGRELALLLPSPQ